MLFLHAADAFLVFIGLHIVVLHFFDFRSDPLLVLLLEAHDLGGLLLGLLDLLPRLHLLLLEQGNSIRQ